MTPNPNSPTSYSFSENDAKTNIDNSAEDAKSKSEPSPKQRTSPPRMQSVEIDNMDVDGGTEQEQITNELRRSRKRARSENGTAGDTQESLSSTEPINKKPRIHEPDVSGSASSSASSSSTSTTLICKTDHRKKIRTEFTQEECDEILHCFSEQGNSDRVCTLLYGENPADWPQIKPQLRHISNYSLALKLLLSECGAVALGDLDSAIHPGMKYLQPILYPSDFDLDRFRIRLLECQQNNLAKDLTNDIFFIH